MKERQIGRELAEKIIHQSDHDKRSFIRFAYDEDWLDYRLYDLIINTDKLSIDSSVRMIIEGAKSDEIKSCGIDSMRTLEHLSLQRRVESKLIEAGFKRPHLFFEVEGEKEIRIYGMVDTLEEKEEVEKILYKVGGIEKIKNDLLVYPRTSGGI